MGYRLVGDTAMVVHFAFLLFVVAGGFLAWRWPRLLWAHLAAALWGLSSVLFAMPCPLTEVENWARTRAGRDRLSGTGFIDHYLEGVVYPEQRTLLVQAAAAVLVGVSWAVLARRSVRAAKDGAAGHPS